MFMMIDCINYLTYNPLLSPGTPLFHITYIHHPKSVITHIYFIAKFWGKLCILNRLLNISNMYSFPPLK